VIAGIAVWLGTIAIALLTTVGSPPPPVEPVAERDVHARHLHSLSTSYDYVAQPTTESPLNYDLGCTRLPRTYEEETTLRDHTPVLCSCGAHHCAKHECTIVPDCEAVGSCCSCE